LRQKTNILDPDNRHVEILAFTSVADISLLHYSLLAAEQAFLHLPEGPTGLNEIYGFNAGREAFEVSECLCDLSANISSEAHV
jgi:hypothetical protein